LRESSSPIVDLHSSLHDALPISDGRPESSRVLLRCGVPATCPSEYARASHCWLPRPWPPHAPAWLPCRSWWPKLQGSLPRRQRRDRKSTRLNSSHVSISYAVFCL